MIERFTDHAANERTFLAWIRTSMALVGFGLAIAQLREKDVSALQQGLLIGIGALVVVMSYVRMHIFLRRIEETESYSYATGSHSVLLGLAMVSLLVLVGVFVWHIA